MNFSWEEFNCGGIRQPVLNPDLYHRYHRLVDYQLIDQSRHQTLEDTLLSQR
jgi:hypothetical protein